MAFVGQHVYCVCTNGLLNLMTFKNVSNRTGLPLSSEYIFDLDEYVRNLAPFLHVCLRGWHRRLS